MQGWPRVAQPGRVARPEQAPGMTLGCGLRAFPRALATFPRGFSALRHTTLLSTACPPTPDPSCGLPRHQQWTRSLHMDLLQSPAADSLGKGQNALYRVRGWASRTRPVDSGATRPHTGA